MTATFLKILVVYPFVRESHIQNILNLKINRERSFQGRLWTEVNLCRLSFTKSHLKWQGRIVNREYVSENEEATVVKAGGAEMGSEFRSAGTETHRKKQKKKKNIGSLVLQV